MRVLLVSSLFAVLSALPAAAQCIEPEDTFYPADGQSPDGFGDVIDLDGDCAYVCASAFASDDGRVYIYQRLAAEWSEATRIDPPHFDSNGQFGHALAKNGTWLAIAQPRKDGAGYDEGRVEMFTGSGATWSWHSTVVSSDIQPYDEFGSSLSLNGTTLVVGAIRHPGAGGTGALYVFDWDGANWTQSQTLVPADAQSGDLFGQTCVIRSSYLAVSSPGHDTPLSNCGAVYVYEKIAGTWTQQAKLTASDAQAGASLGNALALYNGSLLVGCGSFDANGYYDIGKVYFFRRQSTFWFEEAQVQGTNSNSYGLGRSVAYAGNYAALGAPGSGNATGSVQLYQRVGTQWSFVSQLSGTTQMQGARLGTSVALSGDLVCSGGPNGHGNASSSGLARAWSLTSSFGTYCTAKTNSNGCVPQIAISGAPSVTSAAPCTISATSMLDNKSGMFVYSTAGPIAVTFQGGLLCVQPPLQRTPLQVSGGTGPCDGVFSFDLKAWMTTGFDPTLIAGARVWGQFWSRDPGFAVPNNTNLTDGAYCIICP